MQEQARQPKARISATFLMPETKSPHTEPQLIDAVTGLGRRHPRIMVIHATSRPSGRAAENFFKNIGAVDALHISEENIKGAEKIKARAESELELSSTALDNVVKLLEQGHVEEAAEFWAHWQRLTSYKSWTAR